MSFVRKYLSPDSENRASQPLAAPIAQVERISIIDSIRGVALLGILMMNIPYFALPYPIVESLDILGEYSGPNFYSWLIVSGLFEGTMRALFSMLFGAGSLLLLSRLEKRYAGTYPADIFYRRLLWLLVFGLINAYIFNWAGDILYTYAICGLLIFPFRNIKPKLLLVIGIAVMLVATMRGTLDMYGQRSMRIQGEEAVALAKANKPLSEAQQDAKEKWEKYLEKNSDEYGEKWIDKDIKSMHGSYFTVMKYLSQYNVKFQTTVFYDNYLWDALALFFIGMALFKWQVLTGQRSVSFYVWLSVLCYIPGVIFSYFIIKTQVKTGFAEPYYADSLLLDLYQPKRLLIALGHLGVLMVLYKKNLFKWFFRWMSKVGQMAFSNYLFQSIFCSLIFFGYGLGLYAGLERHMLYYVVGILWIIQIVFSIVWLKYFRFGPFEWAWRSLTYWQVQPMKRKPPVNPMDSIGKKGHENSEEPVEKFSNHPVISGD